MQTILVLCLIVAAYGYSAGDRDEVTTPRPGIPYVTYFDCRTTKKQHNKHPWDCTRFIQCDEWNVAFDMPCAPCKDPALCPDGGYLEFDGVEIKKGEEPSCIWPVHSKCEKNQTIAPPTTTEKLTTPEPPPSTTPEWCDASNCEVDPIDGICRDYIFCKRIPSFNDDGPIYNKGRYVSGTCGDRFFNPEETLRQQVAECSVWGDLTEKTRTLYEKLPGCIPEPCRLEGACFHKYKQIWDDRLSPEKRECKIHDFVLDDVVRRCLPCANATRWDPDAKRVVSCSGQGDC